MSLTWYSIKIGNITEDPLVAVKSPSWIDQAVPLLPTSALDQRSPVFVIDYQDSYLGANYIECPKLGRKYFIQNKTVDIGKKIVFSCIVDPLSSFDLSSCMISVLRNEGIGAPTQYIDSKLPVYPSKKNISSIVMQQQSVPLNSQLDTSAEDCYLLTVIGGSPTL